MIKAKNDVLHILGVPILPGESKEISLDLIKLHTTSTVEVPIIVERSKIPGPTILFTAGIHGDEVNGVEIVRQLIASGVNKPKCGTIICIPVINIFGFINLKREFPDGRDLNRVFPGTANGSLASRVAFKLVHDIIPHVDLIIDYHTGSAGRFNVPQLRFVKDNKQLNDLSKVFGAPFVLYSKNLNKSFRNTCHLLGKPLLLFEGGKSFHIDETVTAAGVKGAKRILQHFDMLKANFKVIKSSQESIYINESTWKRAKYSGMFKPAVKVGIKVNKKDILGTITDPFGKFNHFVKANNSGYIINVNESPIVYQGDALFHITTKLKR